MVRVLVVEDNAKDICMTLGALCEMWNHEVATPRSTSSPSAWMTPRVRALVPGRRRLDGQAGHGRIPVIVFTGMDGADGILDGACVIRKTDPEALLDLVDETATPVLSDE